jgi:hypothetical protein
MSISLREKERLNAQYPDFGERRGLGDILAAIEEGPVNVGPIGLFTTGNLGHDAGAASDGVLVGTLTARAMDTFLLKTRAHACLAIADDGGAYTDETTPANQATADDMTILPIAAAQNDAYYLGHATKQFDAVDLVVTTQGNFSGVVALEYWDSDTEDWEECVDGVDGTSNCHASAGTVQITHTPQDTWGKCLVDGVLGYWLRIRVTTATSGGGFLAGRAYVIAAEGDETWTDDTTDMASAGAGDVALLPTYAVVGDAAYFGDADKFCKVAVTISQARTGTATLTWEYWNGTAWAAITVFEDASAGFSTGTSSYVFSFQPPTAWAACTAANGPNGEAGYFIRCRMSAKTTYTAQPLATIGSLKGFAGTGLKALATGTVASIQAFAGTVSGSTGDSVFLIVNVTQGTYVAFTWTKATAALLATISLAVTADDQLALVQVGEDGSTEFANVNWVVNLTRAA